MKTILIAIVSIALCGCARFHTKQIDRSYEKQAIVGPVSTFGNNTVHPTREIITSVSAYTFFSASSELAKFKATQTDKTQSASVGSLNQSAEVSTNLVGLVNAISAGATTAALQYIAPKK